MFKSRSTMFVWQGVLALAVGIIAIVWPDITIEAVVLVFAAFAFVDAFVQGMRAFASQGAGAVLGYLLLALIESAEHHGIWTLQGATIAGNTASLALQTACGFRVVGHRERIAKRDGQWHDTVLTERRSRKIGW